MGATGGRRRRVKGRRRAVGGPSVGREIYLSWPLCVFPTYINKEVDEITEFDLQTLQKVYQELLSTFTPRKVIEITIINQVPITCQTLC